VTRRRLPRWAELRDLVPRPGAGPAAVRASSIEELRELGRRRVPRAVFDYVDGAAEAEISLSRNRAAFRRVEFTPRVLHDVSAVDLSTTILGKPSPLPLVLAPTGFTRMMHHRGEAAVARAAARAGLAYTLSTMGTTSIEDLVTEAPDGRKWFQLYLWRDRAASADLIARAAAAGCDTLMLTVDTALGARRLRDIRNGLTLPPALTYRTLLDGARHPRWWVNLLTTEPLRFASTDSFPGTVADLASLMFDPALNLDDLSWLRDRWTGTLVVKGCRRSTTPNGPSIAAPTRWSCPTTAGGNWTAPPRRSNRSVRSVPRWTAGPRCTWTVASCPAATSSPRSGWARGPC
jgi:L-lactate dehydrogenase (cytochrome)